MKKTINDFFDRTRFLSLLFATFAGVAVISCGDDEEDDTAKTDDTPTETKLLGAAGNVSFTYNSDGTPSAAIDDGYTYLYTYSPEKITNSAGTFSMNDITRNSFGAITSMSQENTGGSVYKTTATYDNEGHLLKYVMEGFTEATYTWSDGKLVKFVTKGTYSSREETDEAVFEYNDNQYKNATRQYTYSMFECEIQGTDWLFLSGSFGVAGDYLPTKVTSTENITYSNGQKETVNKEYNYSYTLNSDGTVASETSNGTTRTYTYLTIKK